MPCMYYTLSLLQTKLANKALFLKKSTFYVIVFFSNNLYLNQRLVNDIFENEKLNLNLNSIRWKKDKGPENSYDL